MASAKASRCAANQVEPIIEADWRDEGRYLTSPTLANGTPQSLAVAQALIDKLRRKA